MDKRKIRRYFYIGSISVIVLLVIIFSYIHLQSLDAEYSIKINQLSSGIIEEKKRYLREAVERTIYFMEQERNRVRSENASSGLTAEQVRSICQKNITDYIHGLKLIDNGYVWVNHIVNYEGGDNYAIRQIHPNLRETEGMRLSTSMRDIKGNLPYKAELEGVKKDGELYFDYYFKKKNSDKISHKMSFAKLYKPYDWVVAAGVYLDDVDQLVAKETKKMRDTINKQLLHTSVIAFFAILISIAIMVFFEKNISALILSYEEEIKDEMEKRQQLIIELREALAEVKTLSGFIPICAHCKKIRDDEGYWQQVEQYVQERSQAQFSHGICPECAKKYYPGIKVYKD